MESWAAADFHLKIAEQLTELIRDTEVRERFRRQQDFKHTKLLRELAQASGGRFLEAKADESLEQTLLEILEEMKTR